MIFAAITFSKEIILQLIQHFLIPFTTPIFFLLFLRANQNLEENKIKYFKLTTWSVIFLAIADCGEFYCSMLDYPTKARIIFAASAYSLRVCIIYYMLFLYIDKSSFVLKFFITIPMLVNVGCAFAALYTPLSFSYNEYNEIQRGILISSPFIVSIFYFTLFVFFAIKKAKANNKRDSIILTYVMIIIILTTILEAKFYLKGLLSVAAMISTVFYYILVLLQSYEADSLTGCYVRFKLYRDIGAYKEFSMLLLDVNGLKAINDNHGHLVGDQCLISIVQSIREIVPSNSVLYRMGGDEFVVILINSSIEELMDYSRDLKVKVEENGYSISIGYSIKEDDTPFDDLFKQADTMLYQDKEFYKSMKK